MAKRRHQSGKISGEYNQGALRMCCAEYADEKILVLFLGRMHSLWRSLPVTHPCEPCSSSSLAKLKALAQQMQLDFGLCVWRSG